MGNLLDFPSSSTSDICPKVTQGRNAVIMAVKTYKKCQEIAEFKKLKLAGEN